MAQFDPLNEQTRRAIDERIAAETELTADQKYDQQGVLPKENPFMNPMDVQRNAIQAKANRSFENDLAKLKTIAKFDRFEKQSKNLNRAKKFGLGALRHDEARYAALNQRRMGEEAQRAALLGSILGLVGAGAGAALGGAGGAVAGGAVGQGLAGKASE